MKDIKIILTLEDYFDIINFEDQPPKEQIAYILYYVTKVAKLRKDMIPAIISDRIEDQYKLFLKRTHLKDGEKYNALTRAKVKEIMQNTPEYFEESLYGIVDKSDRKRADVAYVLTKKKYDELESEFTKEVKDKIVKVNRSRIIELIYIWIIIIYSFFLLFFSLYGLFGIQIEDRGDSGTFIVSELSFRGIASLLGMAMSAAGIGYGVGKRMLFSDKN